ncbi:MAG: hypothetical protein HKO64_04525 [Xanthomonadales bacterium]|nr:hypothetical protein [Xanthomonadales bacterium]
MEPVILDGDHVQSRKQSLYWPGDIITYAKPNGLLVSHRFLGYVKRAGWKLLTQADNSQTHDGLILPSQVLGRVVSVSESGMSVSLVARIIALGRFSKAVIKAVLRKAYAPEAG